MHTRHHTTILWLGLVLGAALTGCALPAGLPAEYSQDGSFVTADLSTDGILLAVSFTASANEPGWTAIYNMFTAGVDRVANGLSGAQFSPDGTKLAGVFHAAGDDALAGEVRLYDVAALPALAAG